MEEIWKDITGYENMYQVSNLGRIKSLKRAWISEDLVLNPEIDHGYLRISLHKCGKHKHFRIHRLVAVAFINNPHNKLEVNHKDKNRQNNTIENLEWVTRKENEEHANKNGRSDNQKAHINKVSSMNKKSIQGFIDDVLIYEFDFILDAQKHTRIDNSSISKCCLGKVKYAGKLNGEPIVWRYKDTVISEIL